MQLQIITDDFGKVQVSDGYHTFDELYQHRMHLFIALCRMIKDNNYYIDVINDKCKKASPKHFSIKKSKFHFDGTGFEGMFIMQLITPYGQISYHLDDKYWDKCGFVNSVEKADNRDGHTSDDVLDRLLLI